MKNTRFWDKIQLQNKKEKDFFKNGLWKTIPAAREQVGQSPSGSI